MTTNERPSMKINETITHRVDDTYSVSIVRISFGARPFEVTVTRKNPSGLGVAPGLWRRTYATEVEARQCANSYWVQIKREGKRP
jgi:hypothetical protein